MKKLEADAYEVFKHEYDEIMLDFEEFSKVPLDTDRFDKIRDMFTSAGERGRKAIGKVIHKGITDPDVALRELETWCTKEEGLLA